MIVKLLTEHHLEFLSLKGGCTDSSESTHVKMPHCWRSHAMDQIRWEKEIKCDTCCNFFSCRKCPGFVTSSFIIKMKFVDRGSYRIDHFI